MRLIDADALAKELMHEALGYQYNRVMSAPTVDAVPVIRCKDCKWWSADTCMEWYDTPYTPADGYCFRAERKEE